MSDLSKKKCVPCSGDTPPLSKELVAQYLEEVGSWELKGNTIERTFVFKNFDEAMIFVNQVADIAKEEEHHPDILIHNYKKVRISLSTHAIKGLTKNDFIVAAKINDTGF